MACTNYDRHPLSCCLHHHLAYDDGYQEHPFDQAMQIPWRTLWNRTSSGKACTKEGSYPYRNNLYENRHRYQPCELSQLPVRLTVSRLFNQLDQQSPEVFNEKKNAPSFAMTYFSSETLTNPSPFLSNALNSSIKSCPDSTLLIVDIILKNSRKSIVPFPSISTALIILATCSGVDLGSTAWTTSASSTEVILPSPSYH